MTDPERQYFQIHGYEVPEMEQRPDLNPMDLDLPAAAQWSADECARIAKVWSDAAPNYSAQIAYVESVLRAALARASAKEGGTAQQP